MPVSFGRSRVRSHAVGVLGRLRDLASRLARLSNFRISLKLLVRADRTLGARP